MPAPDAFIAVATTEIDDTSCTLIVPCYPYALGLIGRLYNSADHALKGNGAGLVEASGLLPGLALYGRDTGPYFGPVLGDHIRELASRHYQLENAEQPQLLSDSLRWLTTQPDYPQFNVDATIADAFDVIGRYFPSGQESGYARFVTARFSRPYNRDENAVRMTWLPVDGEIYTVGFWQREEVERAWPRSQS
jgi:hypothetical protein